MGTITTDEVATVNNGTDKGTGSMVAQGENYHRLLLNNAPIESAGESSNMLTPENEHRITMLGHFGNQADIEGGTGKHSPIRGEHPFMFIPGDSIKKRGMSLAFTTNNDSSRNLLSNKVEVLKQDIKSPGRNA